MKVGKKRRTKKQDNEKMEVEIRREGAAPVTKRKAKNEDKRKYIECIWCAKLMCSRRSTTTKENDLVERRKETLQAKLEVERKGRNAEEEKKKYNAAARTKVKPYTTDVCKSKKNPKCTIGSKRKKKRKAHLTRADQ